MARGENFGVRLCGGCLAGKGAGVCTKSSTGQSPWHTKTDARLLMNSEAQRGNSLKSRRRRAGFDKARQGEVHSCVATDSTSHEFDKMNNKNNAPDKTKHSLQQAIQHGRGRIARCGFAVVLCQRRTKVPCDFWFREGLGE